MSAAARPRRAALLAALALACALLGAGEAGAIIRGSPLAMPLVTGPRTPRLVLAQRAIERTWGASEDSVYTTVDVPEWRSEGAAAGLSALLPGAGQLYVGEGSGWWYALAEVAGWTANRIYLHRAHDARDRSVRYAGNPADTASAWSFERWSDMTGLDPARLQAIWASDRQAFYELIARDPAYAAGWRAAGVRAEFAGIRSLYHDESDRAAFSGTLLWLNHMVAAFDALRAARSHNLMLQHNLELRLRSSWEHGRPALVARVVRRF